MNIIHEYVAVKGDYGFLEQKHVNKDKSQVKNWVTTHRQVGYWVHIFHESGIDVLSKRKRRPPILTTKKDSNKYTR